MWQSRWGGSQTRRRTILTGQYNVGKAHPDRGGVAAIPWAAQLHGQQARGARAGPVRAYKTMRLERLVRAAGRDPPMVALSSTLQPQNKTRAPPSSLLDAKTLACRLQCPIPTAQPTAPAHGPAGAPVERESPAVACPG